MVVKEPSDLFMIEKVSPEQRDKAPGTFMFDKAHVVMSGLVTKNPTQPEKE